MIFNFCLFGNYNKKQTVSVSAECTAAAFLLYTVSAVKDPY